MLLVIFWIITNWNNLGLSEAYRDTSNFKMAVKTAYKHRKHVIIFTHAESLKLPMVARS